MPCMKSALITETARLPCSRKATQQAGLFQTEAMYWGREGCVLRSILPQPSKVLAVSLPRPMGIVLEEDKRRGRVVVGELTAGSEAAKRAKVHYCLTRWRHLLSGGKAVLSALMPVGISKIFVVPKCACLLART